jgi:hypothetical protein
MDLMKNIVHIEQAYKNRVKSVEREILAEMKLSLK